MTIIINFLNGKLYGPRSWRKTYALSNVQSENENLSVSTIYLKEKARRKLYTLSTGFNGVIHRLSRKYNTAYLRWLGKPSLQTLSILSPKVELDTQPYSLYMQVHKHKVPLRTELQDTVRIFAIIEVKKGIRTINRNTITHFNPERRLAIFADSNTRASGGVDYSPQTDWRRRLETSARKIKR